MEYGEFKDALFAEALKKGCEAAETVYSAENAFEVNVLDGEIEKYEVNRSASLKLSVKLNGRKGTASTQALEEPGSLVARAMDNASVIEDTDERPMQGKSVYRKKPEYGRKYSGLSEKDKIALALELEKLTKAADPHVARTLQCAVGSGKSEIYISNTLGLDAHDESEMAIAYVEPVIEKDGESRNGMSFRLNDGIFDTEAIAAEAVAEGMALVGASPVPAGKYRILFRNDAFTDMLRAFSGMFSAEAAQKGLTLFHDKLGERVANENITVIDDPYYPMHERIFDLEGVPGVTTTVIENGVLKSFLHNLKTAKKAGVPSTGNGTGGGIMPTNFYLAPGNDSFGALVKKLDHGLIITGVSGLHAGLNPVSGEFSLIAEGALVEGGARIRPVNQITVGGSFIRLLSSVEAVGTDLRFGIPGGADFASPSVLVAELTVAGN